MTLEERNDAYTARRILRAKPGGRTHRKLLAGASYRVLRMVDIMPPLLASECIAAAEEKAAKVVRLVGAEILMDFRWNFPPSEVLRIADILELTPDMEVKP